LLAQVHVELTGGRQRGLLLTEDSPKLPTFGYERPKTRKPRVIVPSEGALVAHLEFLDRVKNPIWLNEAEAPGG